MISKHLDQDGRKLYQLESAKVIGLGIEKAALKYLDANQKEQIIFVPYSELKIQK